MFFNDLNFFFPELYLCVIIPIILLYFSFVELSWKKYGYNKFIAHVANKSIYVLLIVFVLIFMQKSLPTIDIFQMQININPFTNFFRTVAVLFTIGILCMVSIYFVNEQIFKFEFVIIILFALLGIFLVISANDFVFLYLAIEFQSLALYTLSAAKFNRRKSTEAGIKYFVLGSFSSGLLLFGISLIYIFTGLTNFNDLYSFFYFSPLPFSIFFYTAFLFIFFGIFFKLPAAPFHAWAPDVYQGSPTLITAFFALVPKIAFIVLLARLSYFIIPFNFLSTIFFISGFFSLVLGSVSALFQVNIKRFLAYSTISHIGFILLSFSAHTYLGLSHAFFYLLIYLFISFNFFIILLSVYVFTKKKLKTFSDLIFLYQTNSLVGLMVTIVMFSWAGIPPLAGFFSKYSVIFALINSHMYFSAIFALIITILTCFYYIRIIKFIHFNKFILTLYSKNNNYINFYFFFFSLITFVNMFFIFFFDYFYRLINDVITNTF